VGGEFNHPALAQSGIALPDSIDLPAFSQAGSDYRSNRGIHAWRITAFRA
jgi:hypothetical protein